MNELSIGSLALIRQVLSTERSAPMTSAIRSNGSPMGIARSQRPEGEEVRARYLRIVELLTCAQITLVKVSGYGTELEEDCRLQDSDSIWVKVGLLIPIGGSVWCLWLGDL